MGASGDMLLGALVGAGVPLPVLQDAVDAVAAEPITLREERVTRRGLAATRVHVDVGDSTTRRTWREIRELPLGRRAFATFERLAEAEAAVHATTPEEVHFHEVGALDAIADVVGVCAGLDHLGLEALVCSTVSVGGGFVDAAHGRLPVPAPAVVELLRGVPTSGGPLELELCTPTGAALLSANVTGWGAQPPLEVRAVGTGAGGRDPESHANVLRLLVGEQSGAVLLETNVDDLDPRVWPAAIEALLAAGASDAWLTPIVMKKGRPAHTLSVLVAPGRAEAVRRVVFEQTTSIGLRESTVAKHALQRQMVAVEVDGRSIAVKVARDPAGVLNVQPEYEDVAAAARALGRPVKDVLQEATARARTLAL
ncbi:nickel pincer cofactor biosynthesis protein LarC [Nocardioides mangrovicus]|uniref:Pyridinium-3,5-bisthiocarboxylic acid mononucleotide nickel insertion protein n=2 Tax=Nocardioides mangrovicus TaxID=2478913 RepID=A0A3L8P0J5_9ACTN|nr:nickel pincer cofactor biosynthesis protein LarC [Nocardioides mangrovicus]